MERTFRADRFPQCRPGAAFSRGRPRIRPRQPQIFVRAVCPGDDSERHGPLVDRSAQRRDRQRLGLSLSRCDRADQQLAFHTDLAGPIRACGRSDSSGDHRRRPAVCAFARDRALPGLHAQHGRIVRDPRGFAAEPLFHPRDGNDPVDHGLRPFQLCRPAGRFRARRADDASAVRGLRPVSGEMELYAAFRREPRGGV